MVCPKCGSANVTVQMVTDTELRTKKHGIVWWVFVGWWWIFIKWICFFLPALIVKIFAPRKYKLRVKHRSVCVCQSCGYHGDADEFQRESVAAASSSVSRAAPTGAANGEPEKPASARCEVAGESYYRDAIASLGEILHSYYTPCNLLYQSFVDGDILYKYRFERHRATLMPEPDNPHDPHAIRVDVSGVTVGYIPRTETARVRELMDAGANCVASIVGGPRKLISEDERGDLKISTDNREFSVRLEFYTVESTKASAPVRTPLSELPVREPLKPAEIVMWVLLAFTVACAVGVFAIGALDMPLMYLFACMGGAAFAGALAWVLAGKAYGG